MEVLLRPRHCIPPPTPVPVPVMLERAAAGVPSRGNTYTLGREAAIRIRVAVCTNGEGREGGAPPV